MHESDTSTIGKVILTTEKYAPKLSFILSDEQFLINLQFPTLVTFAKKAEQKSTLCKDQKSAATYKTFRALPG